MNLGLGLALELQNGKFGSIYDGLIKSGATMILDPNRADGKKPGTNSPFVNPLVDLTKKGNNATLNNFIPSSADGYATIIAPNDSGANSVDVNQVVVNGDFANGTTGWVSSNSIPTVANKILSLTGNGIGSILFVTQTTNLKLPLSANIFAKGRARVTNANCQFLRIRVSAIGGTAIFDIAIANPVQNQWYDLREIITVNAGNDNKFLSISFQSVYADATTANGKVMEVDGNTGVFAIPMTGTPYENFTAEQMNQLVSKGYFEGNKTIRYSTPTVLNLDGSNSFGALTSSDDLNPKGGNFSIGCVIRTGGLGSFRYIYSLGNTTTVGLPHLGIQLLDNGQVRVYCGGIINSSIFVVPNTLYKIILKRKNGVLTLSVNGLNGISVANTFNIPNAEFPRLGCRINNADGTTHTDYFNGALFHLSHNNGKDVDKYEVEFNKLALKQFGL